RLEKDAEILGLGWEDYLEQGVVIVEWAEKINFDLDGLRVVLKIEEGNRRKVKITALELP
ncbi:MAG: tRNA (adenosine(37)-N6)-threonylcarbamoyltransferase complex ATPase subunit type 1 TsaE, partial [Candidatus Aminicenantales bacterium]